MSEYRGEVTCPHCGGTSFTVGDWETHASLHCTSCGRHGVAEILASHYPMGITVTRGGTPATGEGGQWHVTDSITGWAVSRDFDSEEKASSLCAAMNLAAGPGGRYGVRQS